jgi:hypothetical protein
MNNPDQAEIARLDGELAKLRANLDRITDTLLDMIVNSTACGCCDNDTDHAALILRALGRFPASLSTSPHRA